MQASVNDASRRVILSFFNALDKGVFKTRELQKLIAERKGEWGCPSPTSFDEIVKCIPLTKVRLAFPSRPEVRYCKNDVSIYELALSVKPDAYLTHHTALHLHGLLKKEPEDIFVNAEQSPKPRWDSNLEQERIDWAFQRRPRTTSNIAEYVNRRIFLLSGKNTGRLGVVSKTLPTGDRVQVTGVERTLIDAVVRPSYCGDVDLVQAAFRKAKGKVSVSLLSDMLDKLDYLYPYHQSIGFFLERSGVFGESEIELLLRRPKEFDFYLEHKMQESEYSSRWRVYYPKRLDMAAN
jgi:predicted transcriptional regulator of viral defense system